VNVGKGIINFEKIIRALYESDYKDYLMLEIEALSSDPFNEVMQGYIIIKAYLDKVTRGV